MGIILKLKRGTTVKNNSYTGLDGEVTVDSDKDALVVHDGGTLGGSPLATEAQMNTAISAAVAPVTSQLAAITNQLQVHRYGIYWDEVNSACKRLFDSQSTTLVTTNFGHFGAANASKNNPFDGIYPWSGRKCVNIDVAAHQALTLGADIKDCIIAWEGDPDFEWDGTNGPVMVYTPEFWGTSYSAPGGRIAVVADGALPGYTHFEETIGARWFGSDDGSGGLTSVPGVIPIINDDMSTIHSKATAKKMTLDDIFTWSADTLLMAVEYATLNSQTAIGKGVDGVYRQGDHPAFDESGVNRVILADATAANYIVGGIIDIGTTDGAYNTARRIITSVTDYATDGAYACVNFDGAPVSITTALFVSLHGKINTTDLEIGSASGYIGTNGNAHAYYRGRVAHAGFHRYVLGVYRQQNTGKIWVAHSRVEAAAYDALNTAIHADTGCVLPQHVNGAAGNGYLSALFHVAGLPLAPFGKATTGGNSANPVGDYIYTPELATADTMLLVGGNAYHGASCGRFFGAWSFTASDASWGFSGFPFLKTP